MKLYIGNARFAGKPAAAVRSAVARTARFVRKHLSSIAYYGCVAMVLSAVAIAAESYRQDEENQQLLLLAADLPVSAPAETAPQFMLPDGAELLRGYSALPEWNGELLLWEAHPAQDFSAEGGSVESICDGTVDVVGKSGTLGGFVEVLCGDYRIRYASIEPAAQLEPGVEIAAGDVIGAASASMPGEASLGAHVHIEVYKGSKSMDLQQLTGAVRYKLAIND